jgi:hypothetical protein
MFRTRASQTLATAALAIVVASQSGCFHDSTTSPTEPTPAQPPALPAPQRISFDFSFFQAPSAAERASKANFFNAYLRATVASAVTQFLLAPPIAAFSLALHTVPSPQDDGSFIWVYTWVDGDQSVQVRLRGMPEGEGRVAWEMRVSNSAEGYSNELWFEGETWTNAAEGQWRFHDFQRAGKPVVAQLDWGHDADGDFLRLTDELDHPGNSLEYRVDGVLKSITYTDASVPAQSWYVKWNSSDGTGSLRAGDYNGGAVACWDSHQNDTVCPPAE